MGLALQENLVAEAGGTLTVRSQPGAGTTVEMQVPAA
jgi:signal transduction histidine kinase